jgi:glycosyltransferase involved in cell wall biosynthesis
MKIAFLNDLIYSYANQVPAAVGGAERQQWLLARELAAAGWSVVVAVRTELAAGERVVLEGVEFVGLGQKQFLWAWYRFFREQHPDWLYWRCASHLLGPVVALAKLARVRTIFSACLDGDVEIRSALFRRPRWWPLYGFGLLLTDRIFVQNQKQLLGLPVRLRAKADVVPSMTPESPVVKAHALREKYVAWVAMLRKPKRADLLVEIACRAPDLRFVVCGGVTSYTATTEYGEDIAAKLRSLPNVEYRGQVSAEDALGVITNAALFLSTSDEEGFPNTFLQAWAAGTPVVSLKIDPDNVIERHRLGRVCGTVETAIDDLRNLMTSSERRAFLSVQAQKYVAKHHSAAVIVPMIERATRETMSPVLAAPQHAADPLSRIR